MFECEKFIAAGDYPIGIGAGGRAGYGSSSTRHGRRGTDTIAMGIYAFGGGGGSGAWGGGTEDDYIDGGSGGGQRVVSSRAGRSVVSGQGSSGAKAVAADGTGGAGGGGFFESGASHNYGTNSIGIGGAGLELQGFSKELVLGVGGSGTDDFDLASAGLRIPAGGQNTGESGEAFTGNGGGAGSAGASGRVIIRYRIA